MAYFESPRPFTAGPPGGWGASPGSCAPPDGAPPVPDGDGGRRDQCGYALGLLAHS